VAFLDSVTYYYYEIGIADVNKSTRTNKTTARQTDATTSLTFRNTGIRTALHSVSFASGLDSPVDQI
jgi:hypothetical protein